jgi:Ca-activated chloride channel family protein
VSLAEIYPGQLPDLFHGGQVVVLGRYHGDGQVAVKLTGNIGKDSKEFVYELGFAKKTGDEKAFVEDLWARRKVGFLLDEIRKNGEKKELLDEVLSLAKKYGIATPYTSWLVVPDGVVPVVNNGVRPRPIHGKMPAVPQALAPTKGGEAPGNLADFARKLKEADRDDGMGGGGLGKARAEQEEAKTAAPAPKDEAGKADYKANKDAQDKRNAYMEALKQIRQRNLNAVQTEKLGVELSIQMNNLRGQTRLEQAAQRRVQNRNCLEVGGVWIDDGYEAKTPTLTVKAMSDAYFKILERHPEVKDVFRLGNYVVWVTPSGTALVIDANSGKDKLNDQEIDKLFVKK